MYKIFLAGHKGMVGSAIHKKLSISTDVELITVSRNELDLTNQNQVYEWFKSNKPDQVYLAAAKVGGIYANNIYPKDFIFENIQIQNNVIDAAYKNNVHKLLFLGSSCIYPKYADQPIKEESLLSGSLEETNEPYALAKICGIKLCESFNRQHNLDYRSVMPTNLYGPNDNFHIKNSHVVPALLRKFHEAKINGDDKVIIWGSGNPRREFLHVDDMASACIHIMNIPKKNYNKIVTNPMCSHVNIGTGVDHKIKDLALIIAEIVEYEGNIQFDTNMPDGPPRKLLNIDLLSDLGWKSSISLKDGLTSTYTWFQNNYQFIKK